MDQATYIVASKICDYLSSEDIHSLSKLNRMWANFICENRKRLPKRKVSLYITRKTQTDPQQVEHFEGLERQTFKIPATLRDEVQFVFTVQQRSISRHYGVCLKKFIARSHNLYKQPDHFNPLDVNEICMDSDYSTEVKSVEDIDPVVHGLFSTVSEKVNFEHLVLNDPSTSDLLDYASSLEHHNSTIRKILISFSNSEIPNEIVDFFKQIKECEEIKLVADRSASFPFDLLNAPSMRKAQKIDIHMGHFSAMTRNRSSSSLCSKAIQDDHDNQVTNLTAETIKIRGTHLTAKGANKLIKQWVSGERGKFNSSVVLNITIDSSKFKKEDVLKDIPHEVRGRLRDSFVVTRYVFGRLEKASLSWFAGRFSFDANVCDELETQGYRLWF